MTKTKIEWTESSWNPVTGCTKISEGCRNCYAEKMARRLRLMGQKNYVTGFELALHEDMLDVPLRMKKPQMIFVNSMSDLFHADIPLDFIRKVFKTMERAHWHQFQVLTKRSDRLLELSAGLTWPVNVWMGVSVENDQHVSRIDALRKTGAFIKFISFEPLIGPVHGVDLSGIDWVIAGGESGPGARRLLEEWPLALRDQCLEADVPFFFKQWGGVNKKKAGRTLGGRVWDEFPKVRAGL